MKNLFKTTLALSLSAISMTFAQKAELAWETEGFKNPESVIYHAPKNILFVSNVNGAPTDKDNNGFISKVNAQGKIVDSMWVKGLNAPKGMAIYKNNLYVSDINQLVVIDIEKGEVIKKYEAQDATFLNDVTVDSKGIVYVSNTFGFSGIYKLEQNMFSLWIKDDKLNMPNGLTVKGDLLMAAGWGEGFDPNTFATSTAGKIVSVNIKTKEIKAISNPIGNLDGIEALKNNYILTDWYSGKLYLYNSTNNSASELLDFPQGSADLGMNVKSNTIFIPFMLNNKIAAYIIK
jgi:hypothetical protein